MISRPNPEITGIDHDTCLLSIALRDIGLRPVITYWDDPNIDWECFDLVVIRSPWDYSLKHREFLAWVDKCSAIATMFNPPNLVRWGVFKDSYFAELNFGGIPVLETHLIHPRTSLIDLPQLDDFVVKPNVGGGSRRAGRYTHKDRAEAKAHVRAILGLDLTAMIQPYDVRVDQHGERALVFVGGRFLHAVKKTAVLTPGARPHHRREAHPGANPYEPSSAEMSLAHAALSAAVSGGRALYARVDLFSEDGEKPTVAELEVVEPNLFLYLYPESVSIVAKALARNAELIVAAHGGASPAMRLPCNGSS